MNYLTIMLFLFFSSSLFSKIVNKNGIPKWKEIASAPELIKKNGTRVVFLKIRKWDKRKNDFARKRNGQIRMKRCTGFVVAPQIIMTNWHCFKNPKQVVGSKASFKFERGVPLKERNQVSCNTLLNHNQDLDFALIKCEKKGFINETVVIDNRPFNIINSKPRKRDRPMYIIHQQCKGRGCTPYKRYQVNRIREFGAKAAVHEADSLGGSSGAPIFDHHSHKVIALHHEGNPSLNQAVPMYKVINFMRRKAKKGNVFYKKILGRLQLTVP